MIRTFVASLVCCTASCAAPPIDPREEIRPPTLSDASFVERIEPEPSDMYYGHGYAGGPRHRPILRSVGSAEYVPEDGCDGDDDDGDGLIDEGFPIAPTRELCNDIDDDCDGTVDENVTTPEDPNAIDDDCDGIVDESTLGAYCDVDDDCREYLSCRGNQCRTRCDEIHDECMDCFVFIMNGDDDMMDPVGCDQACHDFRIACNDIGGRCARGMCWRLPDLGCFGNGTISVPIFYVEEDDPVAATIEVCM